MSSNSGTPVSSPSHGRFLVCKVLMLDDTVQTFQVPIKAKGIVLYEGVINKLQLLESDYFDLQYNDTELIPCWLDHEKPLLKQVKRTQLFFKFLLKFYTPDPGLLEEEFTRYLLALQIKRDLLSGDLYCQEHTAVLLASYIVQAELGNYCEEYASQSYISQLHLLPNQTPEIEHQIMEHHKEHLGQSPAEADFNLLDTARKVELYGIQLHAAQDHDGANLHLAVSHSGILVFQNYTKINSFSWAKIRKLCFKRKKFLVKLHSEGMEGYKDVVEFYFPSRNWSKNFWKKCIEHHTFFRCHTVQRVPRTKTKVISHGSSFRYSGRTQKELVDFAREKSIKPVPFERTTSMRTMSVLQSRAGSPKTGTLTSRDMGYFNNTNSMMFGSHSFDRRQTNHHHFQPDVQSERSVHPPIPEAALKSYQLPADRGSNVGLQQDPSYPFQTYAQPPQHHMGSLRMGDGSWKHSNRQTSVVAPVNNARSPSVQSSQSQIDPSQFMLGKLPGRSSEPLLNDSPQSRLAEAFPNDVLSRTKEIEDIPESLHATSDAAFLPNYLNPQMLHHSVSEAGVLKKACIETSVDDLPPLPSPGHLDVDEFVSSPRKLPYIGEGNFVNFQSGPLPPVPDRQSPHVLNSPSVANRNNHKGISSPGFIKQSSVQKTEIVSSNCQFGNSTSTPLPMTTTSPQSFDKNYQAEGSDDEGKKKRQSVDVLFYLSKEILMTERTYKKDLKVITWYFSEAMNQQDVMPDELTSVFFSTFLPISKFHSEFLNQLEDRLMAWEGKSGTQLSKEEKRIGDILLTLTSSLALYQVHFEQARNIMLEMEHTMRQNREFEKAVNDFEAEKVCFLPLNAFILKPTQRIIYYKQILEKMISVMPREGHNDMTSCCECLDRLLRFVEPLLHELLDIVNLQKLIELQRGLLGVGDLVQHDRLFLREGCLQKLSHKGGQQRMFFLFSDHLIYTSRLATPSLQFQVQGRMSLKDMTVTDEDMKVISVANGFVIYGRDKCIVVAASSAEEKEKWMSDLKRAIANCPDNKEDDRNFYPSLKSNSSSEALDDTHEDCKSPLGGDKQNVMQHRANNTMHVCWHRSTSVSLNDHCTAFESQLSGYLLRKFKNSNGWQKLWVVFTNFCLFFYKNFQDEFPLASLPLLNYTISTPSDADGIIKDFVFKLQFKNHVYFFRAESHTTFNRWMEVIGHVTISLQSCQDGPKYLTDGQAS